MRLQNNTVPPSCPSKDTANAPILPRAKGGGGGGTHKQRSFRRGYVDPLRISRVLRNVPPPSLPLRLPALRPPPDVYSTTRLPYPEGRQVQERPLRDDDGVQGRHQPRLGKQADFSRIRIRRNNGAQSRQSSWLALLARRKEESLVFVRGRGGR